MTNGSTKGGGKIDGKRGMMRRLRRRNPLPADKLKVALVALSAAAAALLILTFIVVFYPPTPPGPASYPLGPTSTANGATSTQAGIAGAGSPTSTPSSTIAAGASSATSTVVSTGPGEYASEYSSPYPMNWQDGGAQFSVTGASLAGNEITLTLAIQIGSAPSCVPLDIGIVADESGTVRAPDTPVGGAFSFPDTQSCNGTPGSLYSATVSFNVSGIAAPYLLTSGGNAAQYFFAATSTDGGMDISLPPTQG